MASTPEVTTRYALPALLLLSSTGCQGEQEWERQPRRGLSEDYALEVRMTWSLEEDMDLHLVRAGGSLFGSDDCYYWNCQGNTQLWSEDGLQPQLSDDNIHRGPEYTVLPSADSGHYTIVAHDLPRFQDETEYADNEVSIAVFLDGYLEWSATEVVSGEDSLTAFATISMPDGEIEEWPRLPVVSRQRWRTRIRPVTYDIER
ncbi:MAG: hypothetical protein KC912_16940 [Proteobacteria bacterium]|nr:hypothetical protein [Pseudomonadota bacterium]